MYMTNLLDRYLSVKTLYLFIMRFCLLGEQREIGVESNILSIHNISIGNRKEMSCISYICT
jgi:hypothetical protein